MVNFFALKRIGDKKKKTKKTLLDQNKNNTYLQNIVVYVSRVKCRTVSDVVNRKIGKTDNKEYKQACIDLYAKKKKKKQHMFR